MRDYLVPTLILATMAMGVGIMTMLSMYLSYREWREIRKDHEEINKKYRARSARKVPGRGRRKRM